jgi:flavin reductase (DIM6/NTAB) family NADH-FMN oxidoreductase RutF
MIKTIDPKSISIPELHSILLGSIAPRPIAFASTIDKEGNVNLSPFSFFNVFSANPPILIFSPARRVKDNTTKHTLDNVHEVKETCISIVNYQMVQQVSLSSTEYDKGVNEFIKSGLTEEASEMIAPPRVKESPVSFECIVNDIQPLGTEGGAGSLVICEVVLIHLDEEILDKNGKIDPFKIDSVARLGGNWYSRVKGDDIFEVSKPLQTKGIGIDQLPLAIKSSNILTGNDLAQLANIEELPSSSTYQSTLTSSEIEKIGQLADEDRHKEVHNLLAEGNLEKAWAYLMV